MKKKEFYTQIRETIEVVKQFLIYIYKEVQIDVFKEDDYDTYR